ncbi:RIMS-binding protein 2 isoform X28 [Rhinichthys klamathensis goyatoka]|uniref:RIMS-binding protein 2 isoform X28 n=1 Tax=Rhinichthys klamathensis goyatoka TaxID=3034132 RepID=UPI0024B60AA7|nr:RIMS-binding protein 2 isoform X28 [Rhinichthys klamathensis goyatoka]
MEMMGVERQCEVEVLKQPQKELQCVRKQLSVNSNRTNGPGRTKDQKLRNEVFPLHFSELSPQHVEAYRLLEDRKHKLSPETAALYLLRQQHKLLKKESQTCLEQHEGENRTTQKFGETEISRKRKECEVLEEEVKKKSQSCQTLESELQHVLQEKARLNLRLFNDTQKATKYEQVKSEYEQLQEALYTVTVERDCALLERTELQGKLENLEQVLKHMREAAERRQQLELEHEQALAVLSAKQQEIDLLQKAQVEAKKEHEGAVHLLENHLDSMQLRSVLRTKNTMRFLAKVRDLEEKCRTQSEQFNLLSKELEKFRLQAGKLDILSSSQLTGSDSPGSPTKPLTLSQLLNGLSAPSGKGNEDSMSKISELIRPLQMTEGEKVELLSVKPTFLSRSTPASPRRAFLSEVRPVIATAMDKEPGSSPRSKSRYTGKVRLCVARYNYNPYDGPNEHPEAELPLVAGKYLYVYGTMDEDGFYEGELLDGQQGLVPSNFVDFVQDEELPSIPLLDRIKEPSYLNHSPPSMPSSAVSTLSTLLSDRLDALGSGTGTGTSSSSGVSSLGMSIGLGMDFLGPCSNGTGTLDVNIDEIGEDIVPYPRRITLIKQLAKSVIISWEPPVVLPGWTPISGYNVLVDQEVRMSVPFGGRTKSLIEKLNLASCTHRISIQSMTERGLSDPLRCTLLVGKDVVVAPYYLRVENITQVSAELTWMPSNSNYSHMIFLNDGEYDVVKPGGYKYHFYNLKPMTVYKIRVVARPHQMPWQLPLEQREKKEVSVEFCTQPAGPPLPPQDVQVQLGQTPGVLQIRWKPPPLTSTGTSNGASVIGYIVCTKGQKIAEIMYPTADYVTVELNRIQCLEAREVVVRTISAQGESQDSPVATIPHSLLVPHHGHPHLQSHPQTHPPPYPQAYPPTHPQPHVQPHSGPPAHPHPHPPPSHPHSSPSLYPLSKPKRLPSARDPHAKDPEMSRRPGQSWEPHPRAPSPLPPPSHPGHTLEPPHVEGRRSPSPQRILPQPQGAPIPNTVARAMARQAAQRNAPNSRVERRNIFSEKGNASQSLNSDEEEDGYDSPHARRRGASVDEFLRGSELGRHHHQYSHSEEYYTESSRGSDLSDIMEEDEEELYSEMQLEEGRRRSINSHNTLKILGSSPSTGRSDRLDHSGRRTNHGCPPSQRRPMTVPSIEITVENNSEGSEGNLSPIKDDVYYTNVAHRRKWPPQRTEERYDGYGGRERRSSDYYEESEPEDSRIFVAMFDYDPLSMSPNPDAAVEELPFKEGQIIKVFGEKDTDGFYRAEVCGRRGLIPCNMVSEIQTDDDDMMDQLLKQGFLPLNTPIEKIERNKRSGRQQAVSTRRMVALYDYDPRESSPNVDVEAELTFCAGDVITVFGEIDEDGFYYGELNGHKGLVPSNFLEEVPDDVEVYLTNTPSRHPQDHPSRTKNKRVPVEKAGPPRRSATPTVRPHIPGSGPAAQGPGSSFRRPRADSKKKGLLSKGKNLLKRLGAVK